MESDLSFQLLLILCIVFSAIFSCAETALTTVPETYIRQLIDQHKVFVPPFRLWLARPNGILTTIIVGNNIVNTLAAVLATIYAQRIFQDYVISIATTAVTIALLIFGEITPKTFARHNARSIVTWLMYVIYPIYFLLFPVVWVLSNISMFLVKLGGGRIKRHGPVATEEDIAYLINLSHEEGVFKQEQGEMLKSVMAFRDITAREIMVPRTDLCTLASDSTLKEILSEVAQHGYTRWPVYTEDIDHVIGILYVKDLINFVGMGINEFNLNALLRKPLFIPESMKLDAVLREFQQKKGHLAIVVDEHGGTAGVVTLEDILEEIVGEIRDEYDKEEEEATIKKLDENHFLVDGRTAISDLNKQTGLMLPADEPYDTLGGFVISELGEIPMEDADFVYHQWRFRVVEMDEKRVNKVEILLNVDAE